MKNLVDKALMIACNAHAGQVDKGGSAYILHPLRLAVQFSSVDFQVVAILHDVIEDSEITLHNLRVAGFPEEIVLAINALTKQEGEIYDDFIKRVSINSLATAIKIADLEDNMNIKRLTELTDKDLQRLNRYKKALLFLRGESKGTTA